MLNFFLIILGLVILYLGIVITLNIPGCTGNCKQGRKECDCPLRNKKNDI